MFRSVALSAASMLVAFSLEARAEELKTKDQIAAASQDIGKLTTIMLICKLEGAIPTGLVNARGKQLGSLDPDVYMAYTLKGLAEAYQMGLEPGSERCEMMKGYLRQAAKELESAVKP